MDQQTSSGGAFDLTVHPIGVVKSPFRTRAEAPRQATVQREVRGEVELYPGRGFEDALSDLAEWDHIWLITWFHLSSHYRPKVRPPRSARKRGLFATRAPYRPNPLGLSAVRLVAVEGLTLTVEGLDLVDQTPVLDIKPYVPYADCITAANHGWLESQQQSVPDPVASYQVQYAPLAEEQLAFLAEHDVALKPRVDAALALGPSPHAYRRIRRLHEGYRLAVRDWRVHFDTHEREVRVHGVYSGYRARELSGPSASVPEPHRLFVRAFPGYFDP